MSTSSEMLTPTGTKTGYRNNDVKDMYLLSILGISKQVAAEGSPDTQEFNSYKLICTTSSDESALSKYALTKATWKKPNPKPKSPISYYVEPTHRTLISGFLEHHKCIVILVPDSVRWKTGTAHYYLSQLYCYANFFKTSCTYHISRAKTKIGKKSEAILSTNS